MNQSVKKEIIHVLGEVIKVLEERETRDIYYLKALSNKMIGVAALNQDEDSISVAVLVYSLFKILERVSILDKKNYSTILLYLKNALNFMISDDRKRYTSEIKALFKIVEKIDGRLNLFVEEVVEKAKITKGSKLVERGVSVAKAASLMGISQWELMSYVGKTEILDQEPFKDDVKKRITFARKLFK